MPYYVYVSISEEDRISLFTLDPKSGKLKPQGHTEVIGRPAPLAVGPEGRFLYAGLREPGSFGISSFRIDHSTGGLSLLGSIFLEGNPVFITTDQKGKFLLSAYYHESRVAVHLIGEDGAVSEPPVEWLETARGAHSIRTDPSNRFAFSPHVAGDGPNAIFQFSFDESTGHLIPNSPFRVSPETPEGPRHICFHPYLDIVYSSNEQGSSVTGYSFDSIKGALTPFQTVSTLPGDFEGENTCSQIQITPSGEFLYAPNRGHDSIACFSVDSSTGSLTSTGQVPSETVPRAFSLDPDGKFLYAAGRRSGRLASYRIRDDTGMLDPLEVYTVGEGSMWVLSIKLEG